MARPSETEILRFTKEIVVAHVSRNTLAVPSAHTAKENARRRAAAQRVSNLAILIATMVLRRAVYDSVTLQYKVPPDM